MLLDIEIYKKISIASIEVTYTLCHGLAPYFVRIHLSCLEKFDYSVVSFDDAFHEVSKKRFMDSVC